MTVAYCRTSAFMFGGNSAVPIYCRTLLRQYVRQLRMAEIRHLFASAKRVSHIICDTFCDSSGTQHEQPPARSIWANFAGFTPPCSGVPWGEGLGERASATPKPRHPSTGLWDTRNLGRLSVAAFEAVGLSND